MPEALHCIIILCSYDKMISGRHLGEIVRLVLHDLVVYASLFGRRSSMMLDSFEKFEIKHLASIEEGYVFT